jgi:3-hydroxyacyl-[acyl-carrier-protein] dehydratase
MRIEYFQLIDRIVDIDISQRTIRVEADVPTTHTIFEGHFPGFPLMPGVLLTEAMAQTSGWLAIALNKFERMPLLVGIKDVKLRNFVPPSSRLSIEAGVVHDGSGYIVTSAEIRTDGKAVCDATLTFRLMPFQNDEMRAAMHDMAKRLSFPEQVLAHG